MEEGKVCQKCSLREKELKFTAYRMYKYSVVGTTTAFYIFFILIALVLIF